MKIQPLMQWRWDHDRATVLREDRQRNAEEIDERRKEEKQRKAHLAAVTLHDLSEREFFPQWKDLASDNVICASRRIMTETVRELVELGASPNQAKQIAILRSCIESFNELDANHKFIETGARDDICEEFEAIAHACGLGQRENLADEWREW